VGYSILVDDDPQLRSVLSLILQDEGYEVRHATDGLAALREIERGLPDLVLCDVRLPQLTGTALVARLTHQAPPIRIILMSAHDLQLPPGSDIPFLRKPLSVDAVLAAVAAAFTPETVPRPAPAP
jgi:CheY-like chemotaxis protein